MKEPNESLSDEARRNIEENRARWDRREAWEGDLRFGEAWSGPTHCRVIADSFLVPFLPKGGVDRNETPRDELDILEISPGAGRFTIELLRWARSMVLVDLSEAAITLCKERFRYNERIEYHVNDGVSLEAVAPKSVDLIASWDSLVHVDCEVIEGYVAQFPEKLRPGGIAWIHHSARGKSPHGWRSNMTAPLMAEYAERYGLLLHAQMFRFLVEEPVPHYNDCISIMVRP